MMMLAKDLKRIINQIPDNVPVSIGESYDLDIIGFSFDTIEGIAKLNLTEGYGIVTDSFIDNLFDSLKHGHRD